MRITKKFIKNDSIYFPIGFQDSFPVFLIRYDFQDIHGTMGDKKTDHLLIRKEIIKLRNHLPIGKVMSLKQMIFIMKYCSLEALQLVKFTRTISDFLINGAHF